MKCDNPEIDPCPLRYGSTCGNGQTDDCPFEQLQAERDRLREALAQSEAKCSDMEKCRDAWKKIYIVLNSWASRLPVSICNDGLRELAGCVDRLRALGEIE
jgi:hypothetical protein